MNDKLNFISRNLWVCLCRARLLEVLYFFPHSPQTCSSLDPEPDPDFFIPGCCFERSAWSGLDTCFFVSTWWCCCWCCCGCGGCCLTAAWNRGIWISFLSLEAVQMTMWVAFSGKVICIVRVLAAGGGIGLTGSTGLAGLTVRIGLSESSPWSFWMLEWNVDLNCKNIFFCLNFEMLSFKMHFF